MALVGGDPEALDLGGPAVPGGLAIKPFPCCYALQRPIAAVRELRDAGDRRCDPPYRRPHAGRVSLAPLIHHSPKTGLEGKFSLEYGIAAALLDGAPGFDSFADAAVRRPDAARLMRAVEVAATDGGDHLLTGEVEIEIETDGGAAVRTALALPPGAPERPMTDEELRTKLELCGAGEARRALVGVGGAVPAFALISAPRPRAAPATWPAGRAGMRSTCPRGRRGRRPSWPDQAGRERRRRWRGKLGAEH